MKLALKHFVQNDGEFVDVILLYLTIRKSVYLSWCSHHLNYVKRKSWCKNEHILNLMDKFMDSRGNLKFWQLLITVDGFSAMCAAVSFFGLTFTHRASSV